MKKRLLTGDRPTGPLHLGHYVGSLAERLRFQSDPQVECFFIIADYQVMTDRLDTADVERNIIDVALDYISVGIDPTRSAIFIQSKVPQLTELTTFLSMITTVAKVGRNPTVKEELRAAGIEESQMSLGMFSYPVSQAADILLFQAHYVPVGEDQRPHIELTREIARTFNKLYGETFVLPDEIVSDVPRLLGLDASQKMSKSRNNAIYLSDRSEVVQAKIKAAVTDSGHEVKFDSDGKPAISNLMRIYELATGRDIARIEEDFAGKGYGTFKTQLTDALNSFLDPIRKQRDVYDDNQHYIRKVLREGTERAREVGEKTMRSVRSALKYDFSAIYDA